MECADYVSLMLQLVSILNKFAMDFNGFHCLAHRLILILILIHYFFSKIILVPKLVGANTNAPVSELFFPSYRQCLF